MIYKLNFPIENFNREVFVKYQIIFVSCKIFYSLTCLINKENILLI